MDAASIIRGVPAGFGYDCSTCRQVCCYERGVDRWLAEDFARVVQRRPALESLVIERGPTVQSARSPRGCVFCEDSRCAIERDEGRDAKPLLCLMFPLAFALAPGTVIWHGRFCHNASLAAERPLGAEDFDDLERRWEGRWSQFTGAKTFSGGTAEWWKARLGQVERALRVYESAAVSGLEELLARQAEALGERGLPGPRRRALAGEAEALAPAGWHEALPRALHFLGFHPSVLGDAALFGERCALFSVALWAWAARLAAAEGGPMSLGHVETALTVVGQGHALPEVELERHPELSRLHQRAYSAARPSWLGRVARRLRRRG